MLVKQNTNSKREEINVVNIIYDNNFNQHNNLLDNDNK